MKTMSETLIRNINLLKKESGWSNNQIAQRSGGGITGRTVGLILSGASSPTVGKIEILAKIFGVESYHILMPEFDIKVLKSGHFDRLLKAYIETDDQGRRFIDETAKLMKQREAAPNDGAQGSGYKQSAG